ncbi:hypothetical protein [Pseudaquabacterium rugosum]|jgi:hypothetical protein|uniref:Uncharacterized protein n=1 Tax=Pseudaquabacterium rugosum TaxID=2984194 RepID=A0ABU9B4C1_9BURK
MLRCALAATVCALAALVPTVQAQSTARPFPVAALRGSLQVLQPPDVRLNGVAARLAPGARIRGTDNLLLLPVQLSGQTLTVHYTTELQGLIHQVWVLTAEEAARKPWPTTAAEAAAWTFDPASQTWSRP